jgi:hypothetical protein
MMKTSIQAATVALIAASAVLPALAQAVPVAPAHTVQEGALEVTLSIDRPAYAAGPQVTLKARIEVRNTSASRVEFREMEAEDLALRVLDAAGREVYRWTPGWLLLQAARMKSLKPGKSMDYSRKIRLSNGDGSILSPGKYEVVATGMAVPSMQRYEISASFTVESGY